MAPQSPGTQSCQPRASLRSTYLFLLLVEVVNDDTDEKVQGEERPENNEHDEVDVHVEVVFPLGLLFILKGEKSDEASDRQEWARAAGGVLSGEKGVFRGRSSAQECAYRAGPRRGGGGS